MALDKETQAKWNKAEAFLKDKGFDVSQINGMNFMGEERFTVVTFRSGQSVVINWVKGTILVEED